MEGGDCEGRSVWLDQDSGRATTCPSRRALGVSSCARSCAWGEGGRAGTLAAVYKSETCLERITRTTTRAPARQPEEARDLR